MSKPTYSPRFKGDPYKKECVDCGETKDRLKAFKPRWGKCPDHRKTTKRGEAVEGCEDCENSRNSVVRQPRCVECDAVRGKKKAKTKAAKPTTKKPAKKAAKKVAAKKKPTKKVAAKKVQAPVEVTTEEFESVESVEPITVTEEVPVEQPELAKAITTKDDPEPEPPSKAQEADSPFELRGAPKKGSPSVPNSVKQVLAQGSTSKLADKLSGPPAGGPTLVQRGSQGGKRKYVQANVTEIQRIFRALRTREENIAKAECAVEEKAEKLNELVLESCEKHAQSGHVPAQLLSRIKSANGRVADADYRLKNAREWRDFTAARLRLMLDYALKHTPHTITPCESCAGEECEACGGTGEILTEKENHYAKASAIRLRHFDRVFQFAEWCYKIRARTSDRHAAFEELLKEGAPVIAKWSNPAKTAVEAEDAIQLAQHGLLAAADHYDPSKPDAYMCSKCDYTEKIVDPNKGKKNKEGLKELFEIVDRNKPCPECGVPKMMVVGSTANFNTYAWWWARRHTRARKLSQKRPGLTPSIDDPNFVGQDQEGGGLSEQVTTVNGRAGMCGRNPEADNESLKNDIHSEIEALTDPLHKAVMGLQLQGYSLTEMGQELSLNPKTVSKIRNQAFEVLRERLSGYAEM